MIGKRHKRKLRIFFMAQKLGTKWMKTISNEAYFFNWAYCIVSIIALIIIKQWMVNNGMVYVCNEASLSLSPFT